MSSTTNPPNHVTAPDIIGASRQSLDPAYPLRVTVVDHELGRVVLKLTMGMATQLRDELNHNIVEAGVSR